MKKRQDISPGGGEGCSGLRPSQGTVLVGQGCQTQPPTGRSRGHTWGGGGEADVRPQQCRSLQWDRHSAPAHGCQVRNWDLWLPDNLIFFSREDGKLDFYAKSHYFEMFVTNLTKFKNSLRAKENTCSGWIPHRELLFRISVTEDAGKQRVER